MQFTRKHSKNIGVCWGKDSSHKAKGFKTGMVYVY
jgi:hypothetical protein